MTTLRIKYKGEDGSENTVDVLAERFTIGRHSSNDLYVPISKLSREHLIIERSGENFTAVDAGSSNGTTINGADLTGPTVLNDGDELDLGGGLVIKAEVTSGHEDDEVPAPALETDDETAFAPDESSFAAATPDGAVAAAQAEPGGGIPFALLLIAPVLGVLLLVFVGVIVYLLLPDNGRDVNTNNGGFVYSDNRVEDDNTNNNDDSNSASANNSGPTPTPGPSGNSTLPGNDDPQPTPTNLTETAKVELNAGKFLRSIAQNEPKAFLTSDNAKVVDAKIRAVKNSSSLADNLRSANRNAQQIRSLAAAKNLKPQFLAAAAITKLGNSSGDVLQTAQGMVAILDKLATHIGNERADDTLLMIAAYGQGQAGEFLKMRDLLQKLSNKYPDSTRSIRTIWFLKKEGQITESEFEFAVRFLAIGTIAQNPKDFSVNAEALTF